MVLLPPRQLLPISIVVLVSTVLPPRQQHVSNYYCCVESFSWSAAASPRGGLRRLRNLLRPSSTDHLADLLELYDIVQDPNFKLPPKKQQPSESSSQSSSLCEWSSAFRDITEGVEITSEGVVEGKGLIASRDFSAGEVVALYPIHALGYSDGRSPPRAHERSEKVYDGTPSSRSSNGIVGTSDLLYFEDESHVFGERAENDFGFAMTDPSDKYAFDVNPARQCDSNLFAAHYVNDASFADFSPVVDAVKDLQRQAGVDARSSNGRKATDDALFSMNMKTKAEELDAAAVRLAVDYYLEAAGSTTTATPTATATLDARDGGSDSIPPVLGGGFNVVMCGFGPPPLVAYVTTKPVPRGHEFLATYGLGYWLGKAFPYDDDHETFETARQALDANPAVQTAYQKWDGVLQEALDVGESALRTSYRTQTHTLLPDTFEALRASRTTTATTDTDTNTRNRFRKRIGKIATAAAFWKRS